ncbi:MAG: outer membrane beta-barrel family protein [Bacteroidota bacterium]|nr:outer membrane beta-barrel family protein [Bacteroidota bacterium]
MKILHALIVLFLLWGTTTLSFGGSENGSIKGKIFNRADGKPVEAVAVVLRALPDSTVKSSLFTDSTGMYSFSVPAGDYFVSVQMVGYKTVKTEKITLSASQEKELLPIFLENYDYKLKEVTVTAQRPFIEQKADRIVMNISESITNSGETAYDLLKKAPGVYLDKDDNIILRGKGGVLVTFNDRQTHLSAKDLANYLKGMQSSEIDKIEIITNPPARYDAAGNSGIINIKTKKNLKPGLNGSIYSGATRKSKKSEIYAGGNMNFRYGKWNVYGNYNPGTYAGNWNSNLDRKMTGVRFDQDVDGDWRYNANSFNAGVDYDINRQNTIGIMVRGYGNTEKDHSTSNIYAYGTGASPDSIISSPSRTNYNFDNMSYNLNFKSNLDTSGKVLNVDIDYATFNNNSTAYNDNYFYFGNGSEKRPPFFLKGTTPSDITVQSDKIDYENPFKKYFKLEAGAKFSRAVTKNNLNYQEKHSDVWVDDASRSNQFDYYENVLAGYFSLSYDKSKTSIKAGLRAENTWSKGNSVTMNKMVKRSYLDWFPTFFIQEKLSENHSLGFSYNRRIDRPNYQDLNPFVTYLDQYTYGVGNAFLDPQYTHTFSLTHSYKNALITSLSYSHTTDVITEIVEQNDSTRVAYQTKQNLNSMDNLSLNVNFNFNPVKWYRTNNNVTTFYNQYKRKVASQGQVNDQTSFRFNTVNTFTLPKNYSVELSGFYQSKMLYGMFRIKSLYSFDLGIQKDFLKDNKATLKLTVRDIFKTMKSVADLKYDNIDIVSRNTWDSRSINLNFSYRFGSSDIKPSRQRSTGIDSEQGRIGKGR